MSNIKKHNKISERKLRKIIYEELVLAHSLINEGVWDDTKKGVKTLSSSLSKKFKSVAAKWAQFIVSKQAKFTSSMPDELKKLINVIKVAMEESGESFKLDDTLKLAKEIGKLGSNGILKLVQSDLTGPVKDKVEQLQTQTVGESKSFIQAYVTILESEKYLIDDDKILVKESLEVTSVIGIVLALIGGLPLLFKGLHKLAVAMGATKCAELFEKLEHVFHKFEGDVVDNIVPFSLAYKIYLGLWKMDIKLTKTSEPFNEIEIKAEKQGQKAIKKAKNLAYKILLIYFAYHGVEGALKAGASLLGFIEGTATTVKGIELATAAQEAIAVVKAAQQI